MGFVVFGWKLWIVIQNFLFMWYNVRKCWVIVDGEGDYVYNGKFKGSVYLSCLIGKVMKSIGRSLLLWGFY